MNLNEQQQRAVHHEGGKVLVAAIPGAGKTRVIIERIKYLINSDVPRSTILAVTFTNKATNEMKDRLERDGYPIGKMTISTFHSMCAQILRTCCEVLGYGPNFTIYDSNDQEAHMRQVLKEMGINHTVKAMEELEENDEIKALFKPKEIVKIVELMKNSMLTKEQLESMYSKTEVEAVEKYHERLKSSNAMDFTDLLYNVNMLFDKHPELAKHYRKKYTNILVDEMQDTNVAQYRLLSHLIGDNNIMLVGDEDQSIFSFRQAAPDNIRKFIDQYDPEIIKLEYNYRSTPSILKYADKLIKLNSDRIDKDLKTPNPDNGVVELVELQTDREEVQFITTMIQSLVSDGSSYKDIAILYRTNMVSRVYEETFRHSDIPYRMIGGYGFYDREEVKSFLAYIRYLSNPKDAIAFTNCINHPRRGIGETAQIKIVKESFASKKSAYEICADPPTSGKNKLNKNQLMGAKEFAKTFSEVDWDKPHEGIRSVAENSGLVDHYTKKDQKDKTNRAENLLELVNSFEYWCSSREKPEISTYLQEVQLLANKEDDEDEDDNKVTLMTLHSSKGLEFPIVFMVAMEEDTLPHKMSVEENGPEEERRLAYVGITRAEKQLYFTRAKTRWNRGEMVKTKPSRFLFECGIKKIPQEV